MTDEVKPHPFKPGDWVADEHSHSSIANVKAVYWHDDEALFDLVIYNRDGDKIRRESPVCGGPRTYEPACSILGWERITKPEFPVTMQWVPNENGTSSPRYVAGERLPPANYVPRKRRQRNAPLFNTSAAVDDSLRRALRAIADGHNDPRSLAAEVLGQTRKD